MVKLWSIVVNGIGWSSPSIYYFSSRFRAWKAYNYFSSNGFGVDWVRYAGCFSDLNGNDLLSITANELPEEFDKLIVR